MIKNLPKKVKRIFCIISYAVSPKNNEHTQKQIKVINNIFITPVIL